MANNYNVFFSSKVTALFCSVFHSKDSYECKWYIPLADLSFKPKEDSEGRFCDVYRSMEAFDSVDLFFLGFNVFVMLEF